MRRLVWLTILSKEVICAASVPAAFIACWCYLILAAWSVQAGANNIPPTVSIIRPPPPDQLFSVGQIMKLKAEASDPDGSIARVEFYVATTRATNIIGMATNLPYNVLWFVPYDEPVGGPWLLTAVALDNEGARTRSSTVEIRSSCILCAPIAFVDIVSPHQGEVFPARATFLFSGEVLVSLGDAGPMEFLAGTNSLAVAGEQTPLKAQTPPTSITVSNLAEGEHKLSIRYRGVGGGHSELRTIRVVNLGVQSPRLDLNGRLQFDIVTSYPGRQTIIETSENLLDWVPISTNQPSSSTFTFTESSLATNSHRFYRVFLPPE